MQEMIHSYFGKPDSKKEKSINHIGEDEFACSLWLLSLGVVIRPWR